MSRLSGFAMAFLLVLGAGCVTRQQNDARAGGPAETETQPRAAEDPSRPTAAVARSGAVALRSFALAGRVAWGGLTTAGSAVRGLVVDGGTGARAGWNQGAAATREVARTEAAAVRAAARGQGNAVGDGGGGAPPRLDASQR